MTPTLLPDDDEPKDTPPAEHQRHEQDRTIATEEQTTDGEEGTNATEEKIKSVKAGLGLAASEGDRQKIREAREGMKRDAGKGRDEEEDNLPPALPPRPPPRPRQTCTCTCVLDEGDILDRSGRRVPRYCWTNGLRKYVFLCCICGSLSILLGALFLIVYFILKSYTSSLNHFETIPTYVPSGMLIATGFLIVCLACRKNRTSFLMKMCGLCSLCCAVLCVSVTVTTTVIHMNRLQTLRECLYTLKTQSCTCYSVIVDNDKISDEGIKFVFNSTPDCEVIHGALYSCLRAIFGLSVIGILICIFSYMLVYQLLSHEKKKKYWDQLEMRCRYLYRQQRNPYYCEECRFPSHPHDFYPWDLMGNRFWSTGRTGNLYTPNPEERGNASRLRSGWNWRRLPWSRTGTNSNEPNRASLNSPDSQYGFSSTPAADGMPYTVLDSRVPEGLSSCHAGIAPTADIAEGGFFSWDPPPPYASNRNSANNSPARRSLGDMLHQVSPIRRNDNVSPARAPNHLHRHHIHHTRQCTSTSRQAPKATETFLKPTVPLRPVTNAVQQQQDTSWSNSLSSAHPLQRALQNKGNYENIYDGGGVHPSEGFNTLPSLKRRTQPRVGDIFNNENSAAYFYSSAENLPPRMSPKNPRPKSPKYVPSTIQKFFLKGRKPVVTDSPKRSDGSTQTECSLRKTMVSGSPSSQKPRQEEQAARRKDNVMAFDYRTGIPKETRMSRFMENSSNSSDPPKESQLETLAKSTKYIPRDVDPLQKQSNLMIDLKRNLDSHKYRNDSGERRQHLPTEEDYFPALQKPIENESDVYFGDVSNSSCYNDGLVYEDTEGRLYVASYSSKGDDVLGKQNLNEQRDDSAYARQSCRHRSKFLPPEQPPHHFNPLEPPTQDPFKKNPRRLYPELSYPQGLHPYYQQESKDELSSGSLTADSGISTGRNFTGYHEIEPKASSTPQEDISALDFSHPLFQKPKILPRGGYREIDSRQNQEESESVSDGDKRRRRTSEGVVSPKDRQLSPLRDKGASPQEEPFSARTSPKPLPRTSPGEAQGKGCRHQMDYIAPDAQYEFQGARTPGRGKPAVPARPPSVGGEQKKGVKGEGAVLRAVREGRGWGSVGEDLGGGSEGGETGSHAVKV